MAHNTRQVDFAGSNVRYGTVAPAITGTEKKGDEYLVTPSGNNTTIATQSWVFDGLTWELRPAGGTCPAPMTRATLVALRNSGGLSKDCDYVVTDHVQGRLIAGTEIHLQAVSATELSENVQVNTTYDNEAWRGIYDIDRALVLELQDNRNNIARGINGNEVSSFDWGNVAYTNVVVDNASLLVTYGNTALMTNVTVEKLATLNVTSFTGSMNNITFSTAVTANFTGANGLWRYSTIRGGSSFNASGYTGGGDNYYNQIDGASSINFSNSSSAVVLRQSVIIAGTVNHSGVSTGTINLTTTNVYGSTITHSQNALALSVAGNSHILSGAFISHQTGTMTLTNAHVYSSTISQGTNAGAIMSLNQAYVTQGSIVNNQATGTLSITQSRVEPVSTIQRIAGATGNLTVNYSKIGIITNSATNTGATTVSYSTLEGRSSVSNNSSVVINASRLYMKGGSSVTATAGSVGNLTISDTDLFNSSINKLATSTAGTLSISSGTVLSGTSFIQTAGTGNLTVSQSTFSESSGIAVTTGTRNYTFTRLVQSSVARANLSGTGAGITDSHSDFEMHYRGSYNNSCSGTANSISYSEVTGLTGSLTLSGTTGGSTINRLKLYDGRFSKVNNPSTGTYQLITIRDNGIINAIAHGLGDSVQYVDIRGNSTLNINRTTATGISQIDIAQAGTLNVNGTSGSVNSVMVEQGVVTITAGSLNNVSKKMQSTFTINGGVQSNVHHWTTANKTTVTANTARVDYLGVVSTLPIV